MKLRTPWILFALIAMFGLTACSTSNQARTDEPVAQAQQDTAENPAANPAANPAGDQRAAGDRRQRMARLCPMQVEGTTPEAVKLDGAVAIDFKTTGDVAELRQRGQKMAQMHKKMHAEGGMKRGGMKHADRGNMKRGEHAGMQRGKMRAGQHAQMTPEQRQMRQQMRQMMSNATVESEEIEGGMRMKFTPQDPSQVDELYELVQEHVAVIKERGGCPMAM